MNILAVVGFILLITSGHNINSNLTTLASVLQVLMGLVLIAPAYLQAIKEEVEK